MLPAMADTRGRGPVESLDELGEQPGDLLRGAVDIHVHAAPDPYTDRKLGSVKSQTTRPCRPAI